MIAEKLKRMELTHKRPVIRENRLPVYYGWAKINKVMKREALMVIFLNENPGPRVGRDGSDGVTKWIVPVYKRWQTQKEAEDGKNCIKMYTTYDTFMDDKRIGGSLEAILQDNDEADRFNVSKSEREVIRKALYNAYMEIHPNYKEPQRQLLLTFNELEL